MIGDRIFGWFLTTVGVVIVALAGAIGLLLVTGSAPAWQAYGLSFLTTSEWDITLELFGALPFIGGTLVTAAIAMAIAVPIGVASALFISEMAPRRIAVPLTLMVELIAAIPSVIVGLWGLVILGPVIRDTIEIPIVDTFGDLPFLGYTAQGNDILTASLLLALMVTPTIVAIAREVFASVPNADREAMIGLGGSRWDACRRVVLPAARSGVVGAAILALGRAMGETIAVSMTIGNSDRFPSGFFEPAQTIASKLAASWKEAAFGLETDSLLALALVLAAMTGAMVIGTRLIVRTGRSMRAGRVA